MTIEVLGARLVFLCFLCLFLESSLHLHLQTSLHLLRFFWLRDLPRFTSVERELEREREREREREGHQGAASRLVRSQETGEAGWRLKLKRQAR